MIENPGDLQPIKRTRAPGSGLGGYADEPLGSCEVCGAKAVRQHGMDNTPLCLNHFNQAEANVEATVKYMKEKREMRTDIPNEYLVKQVILIRRDLGMRRGKEIAQGAHASIAFLTDAVSVYKAKVMSEEGFLMDPVVDTVELTEEAWDWIEGRFTKVVLQVFSEEELLSYYDKARAAGLTAHVIQDSGQTEFKGQLTYTTCAIGPNRAEDIDKVTGDLKLY